MSSSLSKGQFMTVSGTLVSDATALDWPEDATKWPTEFNVEGEEFTLHTALHNSKDELTGIVYKSKNHYARIFVE